MNPIPVRSSQGRGPALARLFLTLAMTLAGCGVGKDEPGWSSYPKLTTSTAKPRIALVM